MKATHFSRCLHGCVSLAGLLIAAIVRGAWHLRYATDPVIACVGNILAKAQQQAADDRKLQRAASSPKGSMSYGI
ncbi:MAG: hypothetical protein U0936_01770 [Planctomycetaceae bacterium]